MDLQPTLEQRLILINQYKILEKLYPEEAETYSQHREILEEGYTLHYNDLIQVISEDIPENLLREVLDILDMYRGLYFAVASREKSPEYKNKQIYFPGFDGNEEVKHLKYTLFFIFKLDRYDELKKLILMVATILTVIHLANIEKCFLNGNLFQIRWKFQMMI